MQSIMLPFAVPIYARGGSGVPTTTLEETDHTVLSWEHSITDSGGFESGTLTIATTPDEAVAILDTWLMTTTVVSSPDALTIFEGYCTAIECDFGTEKRSLSLDAMANAVIVKYTDTLGAQQTAGTVSSAASIALYGTKQRVLSFEKTGSTDATQKATRALAALSFPTMQRASNIPVAFRPGDVRGATVKLHYTGCYPLLDWLTTSNPTATGLATNTQIVNLLTAYRGVNPFYSFDYSKIITTGVSKPQTISANTTYRKAIDDLAASGDSAGRGLVWGFLDDQTFMLAVSAEATPETITYRRSLGSAQLFDTSMNRLSWWAIRPNAMYEIQELLNPVLIIGNPDSAAQHYISRIKFSISSDSMSLELEGRQGQTIDRLLAMLK